MRFTQDTAEIWVPDGTDALVALRRTTHMGVGAHHDDLEIMCLEGILAGFGSSERWFTGVVVTDGGGSARDGIYADYTDEQMKRIRREEQKKAAIVGEYSAVVFLDLPSSEVKNTHSLAATRDLYQLFDIARPEIVYTHNLADKHPTHIGVGLGALKALRRLQHDARPGKLYGCEVWRDLDWMLDADKVVFRLDGHENIAAALVGVFDSQIAGGKRYDLATLGRRRANATYHQSHAVDTSDMINFAMDLTPLIEDDSLEVADFVAGHIDRFRKAVTDEIGRYDIP